MNTSRLVTSLRHVVVILLSAVQVQAADPLRLNLSPVTSNIRSGAPVSLNVHLDWSSVDLLEGRLELTCRDGKQLLNRTIGSEVALLAGDRHSRTVLPPMALARDLTVLTVNARFLGESADYDLGSFELRLPVHWRRSFVIGIVLPYETARVQGSTQLGNALRLDQLGARELSGRELVSIPSHITSDDLRASGLGLFSFDVLALTKPGFKALAPAQLDALASWVEAGGSLFVIVDSTISRTQARFLNRIAGLPDDVPGMLVGTDALPPGITSDPGGQLRMYRAGLGRSVILPSDAQAETDTDLRAAAAYLWKVRSDIQSEFRETGSSELMSKRLLGSGVNQFEAWQSGPSGNSEWLDSPFQPIRLAELDSLTTILLPDEVRSIPLGVVIGILTMFLVAIVPVDYFVLGHFHCRRFTWALLPVVSLLFTGFTAWLGNAYLGSTDYRTSLEFVDLTADNHVIRNSRFEMLFTATQREVATELKQTLYTGVSVDLKQDENEWGSVRGGMPSDVSAVTPASRNQAQDVEVPLYEGNMPALFTVRQQMRKWSPRLSRQTTLRTESVIPPFDLDDIRTTWQESPQQIRSPEWQRMLGEKIESAVPQSTVLLFTQAQVLDLTQGEGVQGSRHTSSDSKGQRLLALVRKVCVRPAVGLFSIVSQISPNGAGDFEDLTILDPHDSGQLLLVIVTQQGNNYVVFRRLFYRDS